jgi:hypothetical protein
MLGKESERRTDERRSEQEEPLWGGTGLELSRECTVKRTSTGFCHAEVALVAPPSIPKDGSEGAFGSRLSVFGADPPTLRLWRAQIGNYFLKNLPASSGLPLQSSLFPSDLPQPMILVEVSGQEVEIEEARAFLLVPRNAGRGRGRGSSFGGWIPLSLVIRMAPRRIPA